MDEQPQPQRTDTSKIVIAIIVGAVIVAGAIFFVARGPDECAEWNDEVASILREGQLVLDAPPGSVTPEENADLQSRVRRTVANMPEDCEFSDEVQDEFTEFQNRLQQ